MARFRIMALVTLLLLPGESPAVFDDRGRAPELGCTPAAEEVIAGLIKNASLNSCQVLDF